MDGSRAGGTGFGTGLRWADSPVMMAFRIERYLQPVMEYQLQVGQVRMLFSAFALILLL
ncbi:MAG: hypothetical protein V2G42_05615 [bacterium JZ-2024 1]